MSAFEKALAHSRKRKIDECEIVSVKKKTTTIRVTDSKIAEIKQNFDKSLGIRLIQDKKIASIQTTNEQEIEHTMDQTLRTLSKSKPIKFWKGLPHATNRLEIKGTYDKRLEEISGSEITDIVQNMINSAKDSKIDTITGSLNIVSENFELENSNGLRFKEKATYIAGIINAESELGNTPVSGIGHGSGRMLSSFSAEQIGGDAKKMCVESINPQKIPSEKYSIIFEPYSVGEILAFVMAANFNFKLFSEKKSCFSDKFEKEIAVKEFSLVDDPHVPNGMGTKSVDDEGTETKKRTLVANGIFTDTYSNLFDGYKKDRQSTGNASRAGSQMGRSTEPIPASLPHNLTLMPGTKTQEEMIKDTKQGLLVGRLWYTYAVNPIKGDFSCTARSGIRIIKDGEITNPGKSVRIIHSLPKMLKNISDVGDSPKNVIQWASLPSITPSIKVKDIAVSSI